MTEILTTIILSSVKFAMTFPLVVLQFRFSFWETVLWTNVGGLVGILVFVFLSDQILFWWRRNFTRKKKDRKVFTKRNRRIVYIKKKYGLIGIALATPVLLSIPVGAFVACRYYRSSHLKVAYLVCANFIWSVIYTYLYSSAGSLLTSG